jgi:hypothetical protein
MRWDVDDRFFGLLDKLDTLILTKSSKPLLFADNVYKVSLETSG